MEKNNDTLNEDKIEIQTTEVEEKSELSNSEREELEKLRKEKEKPKSRNIYDRIDVKPETLTKVIVFGLVVIIGAIILGILAK
ncbi:MAG: hypothetical protein RR327_03375 [Clostridia bacterium]